MWVLTGMFEVGWRLGVAIFVIALVTFSLYLIDKIWGSMEVVVNVTFAALVAFAVGLAIYKFVVTTRERYQQFKQECEK